MAQTSTSAHYTLLDNRYALTLEGASHLAKLPLSCMQKPYPYKTGIVFMDSSHVAEPKVYHPAFYGCFDWHSSVHGHWMLVRLLKLFPELPEAAEIRTKLQENLTAENIQVEVRLFEELNRNFQRTYGWGWLLQLQTELLTWDDPMGRQLGKNLQPLADKFCELYKDYLPKLNYAVRSGEHTNTAFGLRLAYDYAQLVNDRALMDLISATAVRFYRNDENCPITWEPSGYDFLSPCLEEADLMWRVLPAAEYEVWVKKFLPTLFQANAKLEPGTVSDRTDGKLVHLDGLNLSRAWCLFGIAKRLTAHQEQLYAIANAHLEAALPNVASGDYMGEHWLGSFAVYALTSQ